MKKERKEYVLSVYVRLLYAMYYILYTYIVHSLSISVIQKERPPFLKMKMWPMRLGKSVFFWTLFNT